MPSAISDDRRDLAAWAQSRDEAAFARLAARHAALVAGVCRRQLGRGDAADEAAQATFIVLARRAAQVGDPGRLAPWLFGVALRCCRNARRLAARRAHHEGQAMPAAPQTTDEAAWSDLRPHLDQALTALSGPQRAAVIGYFLEGLPQAEVASRLGISEAAVKKRVHDAVGKLRGWFLRRGLAIGAAGLAAGLVSEAGAAEPALVAACVQAAAPHAASAGASALAATVAAGSAKLLATAGLAAVLACGSVAAYALAPPRADAPRAAPRQAEAPHAEAPRAEAPAPDDALQRLLATPVDARYELRHADEVLADLRARVGLRSAMPTTIELIPFTLHQEKIAAGAVLDRLAKDCRLEIEHRDGRVLVWQRADDQELAAAAKDLAGDDHWRRCEAVFRLGRLADRRIYAPLVAAGGDKDPVVASWALDALAAHVAVLPYVDAPGREALSAAIKARLAKSSRPQDAQTLVNLLAAVDPPASVDDLMKLAKRVDDDAARGWMALGLARSPRPQAIDAVLQEARRRPEAWTSIEALALLDDPRATAALIAVAQGAPPEAKAGDPPFKAKAGAGAWHAPAGDPKANAIARSWQALAERGDAESVEAVVRLWQDRPRLRRLAPSMGDWNAANPRIADAMAAALDDEDERVRRQAERALAVAGDARGVEPAIATAVKELADDHGDGGDQMERMRRMTDPDAPSASHAARALLAIPDAKARQALLAWCASAPDKAVVGPGAWQRPNAIALSSRDPAVEQRLFAVLADGSAALEARCRASCDLANGPAYSQPYSSRVRRLEAYLLDQADPALVSAFVLEQALEGGRGFFGAVRDRRWTDRLSALIHETWPTSDQKASVISGNIKQVMDNDGKRALAGGNPALAVLGDLGSPRSLQALAAALQDLDAEMRGPALYELGRGWRGDPAIADAVAARLSDVEPSIADDAALTLGKIGDRRAAERLRALTGQRFDRSDFSRQQQPWEAARMLLAMADPQAKDAILALAEDPSASFSDSDVSGLAQVDSPATDGVLRAIIADQQATRDHRAQAAQALLRRGGGAEAVDALLAYLREEHDHGVKDGVSLDGVDTNRRIFIVQALQAAKDPAIDVRLVALARDAALPRAAREAMLTNLDAAALDPAARKELAAMADDGDQPAEMRMRAAVDLSGVHGLGFYSGDRTTPIDPGALRVLVALYLKHPPQDPMGLGGAVCTVLARSGDDAALQVLDQAMGSVDVAQRRDAATALAQVRHDGAAIDALLGMAKDKDARAWQTLQALRDDTQIDEGRRTAIRAVLERH